MHSPVLNSYHGEIRNKKICIIYYILFHLQLSIELKGKKKKGKKKVDVSQLDAEIDKIAAQGSGTLETSSNIQKPSPLVVC